MSPDAVVAAFDIAETGKVNPASIQIPKQITDSLEINPMGFFMVFDFTNRVILFNGPCFGATSESGADRIAEQIGPTHFRAKTVLGPEIELGLRQYVLLCTNE